MNSIPYLSFNGDCKDAMTFYADVLEGKVAAMISHRGTPAESQTPPEWLDKIIHARIEYGDSVLMAGDVPSGMYRQPQGFGLNLMVDSEADADRIFTALKEGGTVTMPLAETFWAKKFGMLTDRYGIPWMVNFEGAR
ncbi:VOC family protein [Govanella unica]|uniref:VOC family protein n=1 Tax=Govanella unica TaxID=2975056 RepID=A0A9X3Z7S1_9PROT|nr:VOC family protein [Govania unica]MDA5194328.1 VOC family protein [Govania unica]